MEKLEKIINNISKLELQLKIEVLNEILKEFNLIQDEVTIHINGHWESDDEGGSYISRDYLPELDTLEINEEDVDAENYTNFLTNVQDLLEYITDLSFLEIDDDYSIILDKKTLEKKLKTLNKDYERN